MIDLDRDDVGTRRCERHRQGSEPGSDLDDVITSSDSGKTHDAFSGVRIREEVLPSQPTRGDPGFVEQTADRVPTDRRRAEGIRHGSSLKTLAAFALDDAANSRPSIPRRCATAAPTMAT